MTTLLLLVAISAAIRLQVAIGIGVAFWRLQRRELAPLPIGNAKCDATDQCSMCHRQKAWKPATFDHARFFVRDGPHNAACTTCHITNDHRQYTCYGCHKHTEANIRAMHNREGIPNFINCVSCHRSSYGKGREGRED